MALAHGQLDLRWDEVYSDVIRGREDLHDYQENAVRFLYEHPRSALFVDVGMGKSVICLTLLADLLKEGWTGRALVVAPLRVAKATWPTEIREWQQAAGITHTLIRAEDDDEEVKAAYKAAYDHEYARQRRVGESPSVAAGYARRAASPCRLAAKEKIRRDQALRDTELHIINIEALEWLVEFWEERGRTTGETWPYDVVILDESSKFKDHTTRRYRALNRAMSRVDRVHELTASPASEGYQHLFAQIFLLDRGRRFGRNPYQFSGRFFNKVAKGRKLILRRGADKKIGNLIADICLTLKADDYREQLKVQKSLPLKRRIALNPAMRKRYEEFEKTFLLELDEIVIEAANAASLFNKLLQMSAGAVYDNEGKVVPVHDEKIEALKELRAELGDTPILVPYWFKSSLQRLRKAFPDAVVMDKRGDAVKPWNEGKIKMLLIHPASAGHGLNMQKGPGHHIAWFDLCWSRELYEQCNGRLARQGQARVVRIHHLLCIGTADEFVYECLQDKARGQERLFKFIREARARYANDNGARSAEADRARRRDRIAA